MVSDPEARRRLIAACKKLVRPSQPLNQMMHIVQGVLGPNSEPEDLVGWWIEELRSADNTEAGQWCVVGELLQCWSVIDLDTVTDLLDREEAPSSNAITGLLHASRMDLLESDEELFDAAVDAVLAGARVGRSRSDSLLQRLASSTKPTVLPSRNSKYHAGTRLALRDYLSSVRGDEGYQEDITWPSYATTERSARRVQAFTRAAERPVEEWSTSIEPWDR